MPTTNHNFASDPQPYPTPCEGFAPGDAGTVYTRMIDGHDPWSGGIKGANSHDPNGEHTFGPPAGFPVDDDYTG